MFCPVCGRQIRDNAKFCNYCGKQLAVVPPPAPAPAPVKKKGGKIALLIILLSLGVLLLLTAVLGLVFRRQIADFMNDHFGKEPETVIPGPDDNDDEGDTKDRTDSGTEEETSLPSSVSMTDAMQPGDETDGSTSEASETTSESDGGESETEPSGSADDSKEEPDSGNEETTTAEESTVEETKPSLESQMVGFWVGDLASEITMREDGSCFYQEPQNLNNERVRNGVECEWKIIGNRLMIVNAADYIIYADLSRYGDNTSITILSDAEAWNTEVFTKQEQ